ncbi:MAG: hypothetical protein HC814_05290 [Rhodobacteraceae bacterium]|nr:hypothetical protein [Paracoccaceae bacterium]
MGVPKKSDRWTLAELIDFETALAAWTGKAAPRLTAEKNRAVGMKRWLEKVGTTGLGARWMASLSLAGSLLALLFAGMGRGDGLGGRLIASLAGSAGAGRRLSCGGGSNFEGGHRNKVLGFIRGNPGRAISVLSRLEFLDRLLHSTIYLLSSLLFADAIFQIMHEI